MTVICDKSFLSGSELQEMISCKNHKLMVVSAPDSQIYKSVPQIMNTETTV